MAGDIVTESVCQARRSENTVGPRTPSSDLKRKQTHVIKFVYIYSIPFDIAQSFHAYREILFRRKSQETTTAEEWRLTFSFQGRM